MSLGILRPGQGDQTPALFVHLPADDGIMALLSDHLGEDPRQMPQERLTVNAIAQPVICAVQVALWQRLRDHLSEPRVFAGYSVGELAAYGCAGALEPAELIHLAGLRARLMDAACTDASGLLAVRGLLRSVLAPLCAAHGVEIAIVNGPDRMVIGGRREALVAIEVELLAMGAKVTPLAVAVASHTSFLKSAVAPFRDALAPLQSPSTPVLAGITGAPVTTRERAVETLSAQVAHTIDWAACMNGLAEMGCTTLLELGPGNGLSRMVRDHLPEVAVRSVSEFQSLDGVVAWVERMG